MAGGPADITLIEDASTGPDGYTFADATCTADGEGIPVELGDTSASLTANPGQAISCVFTNRVAPPSHTVTVNKVWENAISGDTATISVGDNTGSSTATDGDSEQDDVVSGEFTEGETVQLGEGLGVNDGRYTADLSCDGVDVTEDDSFTMPDADVTCTYTNTNAMAALTVVKSWVNGVSGDTATLTAAIAGDGFDPVMTTSTSNGKAGTWTDPDNAIVIQVPVGKSVALSEELGEKDAGDYTGALTCDNAEPDMNGMIDMPATHVMCTFTNTNTVTPLTPLKPAALPNTGSSVPVVGLFGGAAGLIVLGGLALFLMWRRRRHGLAE